MAKKAWQQLLSSIDVDTSYGTLSPVSSKRLDAFEEKHGIKLPRSYRTYCEVFGPGEFARRFKVAVPGYKGKAKTFLLEDLNKRAHEGLEYEHYSKDPEQHMRGVFYCIDIVRSYHFFDPMEVTDPRRNEYAVYTLCDDFKVRRTADNFWDFVTEFVLGSNYRRLVKGAAPERVFTPVAF
jgi:hypothetical protein